MKHRLDKAKERYKLDEINPDILAIKEVVNRFQYDLTYLPDYLWDKYTGSEYPDFFSKEGWHMATLRELLDWDEWDGETTVVACGTTIEVKGRMFVPCYCADMFCEVVGAKIETCKKMKRLALLGTDLVWKGKIGVLQVKNL